MDRNHATALWLAQLAAGVANYCDHIEHIESVRLEWVTNAARDLRVLAVEVADLEGIDLLKGYAARLRRIEQRNVLHSEDSFEGAEAVMQARTWRALQIAQMEHDRAYHPDVIGLHKNEQLRHYALHVTKLAGAFARRALNDEVRVEIVDRRLPDLLLFGIKLSTVMGEKLPEEALPIARTTEGNGSEENIAGLPPHEAGVSAC